MKRKQLHDCTHLTLEERKIIQAGIENSSSKASIARTIGKDATTVAKEIRKHREFKPRNTFDRPVLCARMKDCPKSPVHENVTFMKNPSAIDVTVTRRMQQLLNGQEMPSGQVLLSSRNSRSGIQA